MTVPAGVPDERKPHPLDEINDHPCQRCGSDEWTWVDYRGCSSCFEPEPSGVPDGRPVSVESLLDADDFAVIAEEAVPFDARGTACPAGVPDERENPADVLHDELLDNEPAGVPDVAATGLEVDADSAIDALQKLVQTLDAAFPGDDTAEVKITAGFARDLLRAVER